MSIAPPPRARISLGGADLRVLGFSLGGLISACGGPLVLHEQLKGDLGHRWAFALMFAPILLLLLGWQWLDDEDDALSRIIVKAGFVGAALLGALNVYLLLTGTGRELFMLLAGAHPEPSNDLWLELVGFSVGFYWVGAYVSAAARRGWLTGERGVILSRRVFEENARGVDDPLRPSRLSGPSVRDVVLLGLQLTLLGLSAFAFQRSSYAAIGGVLLFGGGAIATGANLLRKWREARLEPAPLVLRGGHRYRPSRTQAGALGAALLLGGGLMTWLSADAPQLFRAICACVALAGGLLCLGVLLGRLPVGFFAVEPSGIRVGERSREYLFPWDSIVTFVPGEFYDNQALFIALTHLEAVEVSPLEQRGKALQRLENNKDWWGVEYVLLTSSYGFPLPSLIAALNRYALVPGARSELDMR